jgi:hypothetical protein
MTGKQGTFVYISNCLNVGISSSSFLNGTALNGGGGAV